nr:PD-(D/E)XK nuclease family protein [Bacteroidales bacterium]
MKSFLKEVTEELYEQYKENISDNCIVFPNKRAALYFKKYLSEISNKPIWSPKLLTINELMQEISEKKPTNNIKLIFELYKIYRKIKTTTESFDEFYYWGEIMLSDFNDIDKYLVNPKQIFQNLSALKNIQEQFNYLSPGQIELVMQFWKSFKPEQFSENQEEFVHLWEILSNIYDEFRKELLKNDDSYDGMINKNIANKIINNEDIKLSNAKYIFIGFNALNECEKTLFKYLKNINRADFYWDYDYHYIDNHNHEAGRFIRENIKNYPSPKNSNIRFNNLDTEKSIKIFSTTTDIGQAKVIAPLLKKINNEEIDDPNKHAIILTDEQILIPSLYAIPNSIDKVNVTMGYPLKDTPIYGFIKKIIELQKKVNSNNNEISFFYKHVISILKHQYINNKDSKISELINDITKKNKIYLTKDELNISDITAKIFVKIDNHSSISEYLLNILNSLFHDIENQNFENQNIEQEYIYHLFITIKQLNEVLSESNINIQIETYLNLLDKIIQSINIPFTGEPLNGLQVMGILETRAIDFENIIILSMNEGIFPKVSTAMSFIPYNLRRGFNLPAIEYQDSIFSYYFYRLLQRAKNITLIYNSSSDGFQTGEMSRFIHQLKFETKHKIKHYNLSYDINTKPQEKIIISKNEEIKAKLNNYIGEKSIRSLSPSAINMYLTCKLKFYFRYIAGLKEQNNLLEEIDPPTFGNILHNTMEDLYTPFLNKIISKESIKSITPDTIENAINKALKKEF